MKGRVCRCGFATLATRPRCPRCGKPTADAEWADSGKVLSSVRMKKTPEPLGGPMDLVMVAIEGRGPKVTCWSEERLLKGDDVTVERLDTGLLVCRKRT